MEIRVTRDTMSDIYFDALRIRNQVFVKEQGVPYELEVGNALEEASAVHFVLYDGSVAQGTVRLLPHLDEHSALIQRMAILKEGRNKGYGTLLLERLLEFSKASHIDKLELHAQVSAKAFYHKYLFTEVGAIFEEAGIAHIQMERTGLAE
ncbi:GNAT family N-acetyltransferase [Lactococcus taiwanensis]|uniref:GNAT family N-acetyltransferase n=1 Tax=Lactococcus taiwanensis TaxID=1151742 RepID=UPI00351455F0